MPKYNVAEVIEVIKKTHGLIAMTARQLGCTRQTVYNYRDKHLAVREALEEAREYMKDVAEDSLFKRVEAGEAWAVCFYLKTQGTDRGYVERQKLATPPDKPFTVSIAELARRFKESDDDRDPAADALSLPPGGTLQNLT